MTFTFGTLCSGIESASEAFIPLGAECRYVSEIEPFPCGVLADRHGAGRPMRMPRPEEVQFPEGYDPNDDALFKRLFELSTRANLTASERAFVKAWTDRAARRAAIKAIERYVRPGDRIPNFGDLTQIDPDEIPAVDLLVAGFPCQDFSIAGLRKSLSGSRGNLTLYGVNLIHELARLGRIRSFLYENVPDLLNTKDNAFGAFLGGIVGHDAPIISPYRSGRWTNSGVAHGPLGTAAWRIRDTQYDGLAQRRERLFLVADFGNGPDPVEVLLERPGLSRNPPSRRQAGEGVARPLAAGSASSGGYRNDADTADNLIAAVATLDSSFARLQGASGQDLNHGHSHLIPAVGSAAFGGNNTSGPIDLATARTASHTASGRQDFETETFIVQPTPFAIMPMNSGKDFKAREVDISQPLMASGPVGGDQGGDYIVQPVGFNAREDLVWSEEVSGSLGSSHPQAQAVAIPILESGKRTGKSSTSMKAGDGLGVDGDPMYTLGADSRHAVAFSLRGREGGAMPEVEEGDVAPSLRAADGGSTRPFIAFDETQITHPANRSNPQPDDPTGSMSAHGRPPTLANEMAVRRITCVEAERLMGFEDNYTLIEWPTANRKGADLEETIAYLIGHGYSPADAAVLAQTPDGPRYKSLGNSKGVPVVRSIGRRYAAALARYLASQAAA